MTKDLSRAKVVDTFIAIPGTDSRYSFLESLLQGRNKQDATSMPANYMFRNVPSAPKGEAAIGYVLAEMDKYGIDYGLVDATDQNGLGAKAVRTYPNRFGGVIQVDPNFGMDAVYLLEERVKSKEGIAASFWPSFTNPQVPINDKKVYPIYAKCSELGIPICITTGVPGPRVPMMAQHVEYLDEVCWFFPDLKIIMRHGAEPWVDLAVKLLLKWPNLYYSTSAFAPKHYPEEIINFANSRGAGKVLYAGYFPVGLSLERIFTELPHVKFNEDVWPKFLGENAIEVFNINSDTFVESNIE